MIWQIIISIILSVFLYILKEKRGWSETKYYLVACTSIALIFYVIPRVTTGISNNYNERDDDGGLKQAGMEFVLQRLKSPSTATFISYGNSDVCRELLRTEFNIILKNNCDAVSIEVEATNGFGGRNREVYLVFFKDGKAIDMIDGDATTEKIRRAVSYLDLI